MAVLSRPKRQTAEKQVADLFRKVDLPCNWSKWSGQFASFHALRYLESEAYRRRIGRQLNKGERLHDLRGWLMFGGDGKIRRKQEEAQTCQAGCLNLMTKAVTLYMQEAVRQMGTEGDPFDYQRLKHLSPARFDHVNRYGKYRFDIEEESRRTDLRPLREV